MPPQLLLGQTKQVSNPRGDDLRAVAGRLASGVRVDDLVGRFGGDEFVIRAQDLPDNLLCLPTRSLIAT
jgi:GGDEF domain-containing protein